MPIPDMDTGDVAKDSRKLLSLPKPAKSIHKDEVVPGDSGDTELAGKINRKNPDSDPRGVADGWKVQACDTCSRDYITPIIDNQLTGSFCIKCLKRPSEKQKRIQEVVLGLTLWGAPYPDMMTRST